MYSNQATFVCASILCALFMFSPGMGDSEIYKGEQTVLKIFRNASISRTQLYVVLLALFWLSGVTAGCAMTVSDPLNICALMRSAGKYRVSIVWLGLLSVLPLLVISVVTCYRLHYFIFPLCALRGLTFGVCCSGVYLAFGSAGWLVSGLLLFSSILRMPVLLWYCLRCLSKPLLRMKRDLIKCIAITLLVTLVDYLWVSPFLSVLMT